MKKIATVLGLILLGTSAFAQSTAPSDPNAGATDGSVAVPLDASSSSSDGPLGSTELNPDPSVAAGNNVQVINHGIAGLEKRFEMIERAQNYIDVEYFIYREDQSGRLLTQALVKKKKEIPGIKIRILIDASLFVPRVGADVASELASLGIEVKYYNPATLLHPIKLEYRDHRKLLSVDGKEAITGSRNVADEYFDLNQSFNFRDRDIWVQGPVVADMEKSFEAYWASNWSVHSKPVTPSQTAINFVTENAHDNFLRGEIARVGQPILSDPKSSGSCESVSFVTDVPGKQSADTRKVFLKLLSRISQLKKGDNLMVESPYFIVRDKSARDEMSFLKDRGISATLLTNSLASTDEFMIAANFIPQSSFYESISDSEMRVFDGKTPKNIDFALKEDGTAITKNASWGIHAKTYIFADDSFAIGTFNVDPRSANLNSEMLLFCENNKALTTFVKDDMKARIDQSYLIDKNGSLDGGRSMFDGVGAMKKFEFELMKYPSRLLAPLL